ncbi:MAG: ribosome-associated protein [Saprospiraceae bacterium]
MKVAPTSSEIVRDENVLIDLIIDSIRDIKGKKIVLMDVRHLHEAPTDYFIVCEGESSTQVRAIADHIYGRVNKELSIRANHKEGINEARWILVDYFDLVVHVFYPEARAFYDLEDLWSDANIYNYEEQ